MKSISDYLTNHQNMSLKDFTRYTVSIEKLNEKYLAALVVADSGKPIEVNGISFTATAITPGEALDLLEEKISITYMSSMEIAQRYMESRRLDN